MVENVLIIYFPFDSAHYLFDYFLFLAYGKRGVSKILFLTGLKKAKCEVCHWSKKKEGLVVEWYTLDT